LQSQGNAYAVSAPIGWTLQACDRARRLGARIVAIIDARADAYTATALYQELSRLSNAELERRGIPRGELHRHLFETLARRSPIGRAMGAV
jgi:hypothetical protein